MGGRARVIRFYDVWLARSLQRSRGIACDPDHERLPGRLPGPMPVQLEQGGPFHTLVTATARPRRDACLSRRQLLDGPARCSLQHPAPTTTCASSASPCFTGTCMPRLAPTWHRRSTFLPWPVASRDIRCPGHRPAHCRQSGLWSRGTGISRLRQRTPCSRRRTCRLRHRQRGDWSSRRRFSYRRRGRRDHNAHGTCASSTEPSANTALVLRRALELDAAVTHLAWDETDAWCLPGRLPPRRPRPVGISAAMTQPVRQGRPWNGPRTALHPIRTTSPIPTATIRASGFEEHRYDAARGQSGDRPRMAHPRYRNYFTPERNDVHTGFRQLRRLSSGGFRLPPGRWRNPRPSSVQRRMPE